MDQALEARARWLASAVIPHEPALRGWLLGQGLAFDDADDMIQEAYAKLAALPAVDHIKNVKTYFFTIARGLMIDRVRRAKIVSIIAVEDVGVFDPLDETPSAETQLSDRQELQRLAEGIAALSGRKRQVLILRKVHGLSQREAAQRLGISESAVETHLGMALEILGRQLERAGRRRARSSRRRVAGEILPFGIGEAKDER
jgi:RNA polymerase sigma factor (sigma-70 family)